MHQYRNGWLRWSSSSSFIRSIIIWMKQCGWWSQIELTHIISPPEMMHSNSSTRTMCVRTLVNRRCILVSSNYHCCWYFVYLFIWKCNKSLSLIQAAASDLSNSIIPYQAVGYCRWWLMFTIIVPSSDCHMRAMMYNVYTIFHINDFTDQKQHFQNFLQIFTFHYCNCNITCMLLR